MKRKHTLALLFVACILLVSLCLQSCDTHLNIPNRIEENSIGLILLSQEDEGRLQKAVAQGHEQSIDWLHELEGLDKEKEKKEEHMKQPTDKNLADYQNSLDFAMIRKNPFVECPEEITFMILELAARANYLNNDDTGITGRAGIESLILVCRYWREIMGQDQMKKSIDLIKPVYEEQRFLKKFLKGTLVYRPNEGSDKGRIVLPIASLENPLEGTFDLLQCGDAGKYLSISTGYRKGKKAENATKIEIWLTPRLMVAKEIQGSASHFQEIFPSKWPKEASVGIFWTWGDSNDMGRYDYLTTESMDALSNDNLYKKWIVKRRAGAGCEANITGSMSRKLFPFHYVN